MSIRIDVKIPYLLKISKAIKNSIKEVSNELLNDIRSKAPVRSGALRSSFNLNFKEDLNSVKITLSSLPYALMVDQGTKAYTITPNSVKTLRFTINGKEIFAKSVTHPGIRGRSYIQPYNTLARFNSIISKNIEEAIRYE